VPLDSCYQIPDDLKNLCRSFEEFLCPQDTSGPIRSVQEQIEHALQATHPPATYEPLSRLKDKLNHYILNVSPTRAPGGRALLSCNENKDQAVTLSIIPPRRDLPMPTEGALFRDIADSPLANRTDWKTVERVFSDFFRSGEIFHAVPVDLEQNHPSSGVRFEVPFFDKRLLIKAGALNRSLLENLAPVNMGETIAHVEGAVPFTLSEAIEVNEKQGEWTARTNGVVVLDNNRLDIVPFYILETTDGLKERDLDFSGDVLILGDLKGDIKIRAMDVYVLGSLESVSINAIGNICIEGNVFGKHRSVLKCGGMFSSAYAQDARITAGGDVRICRAIHHCDVTSNRTVRIPDGVLTSGRIEAGNGIICRKAGSGFAAIHLEVGGRRMAATMRMRRRIILDMFQSSMHTMGKLIETSSKGRHPKHLVGPDQDLTLSASRYQKYYADAHRKLEDEQQENGPAPFLAIWETLCPPGEIRLADIPQKLDNTHGPCKITTDGDKLRWQHYGP